MALTWDKWLELVNKMLDDYTSLYASMTHSQYSSSMAITTTWTPLPVSNNDNINIFTTIDAAEGTFRVNRGGLYFCQDDGSYAPTSVNRLMFRLFNVTDNAAVWSVVKPIYSQFERSYVGGTVMLAPEKTYRIERRGGAAVTSEINLNVKTVFIK